jgi:hypothetical protein
VRDAGHIEAFAERRTNEYAVACVDRVVRRLYFMKLSFGALTLGVLVIVAALPALAETSVIHNKTATCAWATVDTSGSELLPWTNKAYGYIKPGESRKFSFPSKPQVKVRAEPTKNADCSGGKIADVSTHKKETFKHAIELDAEITGGPGSFGIRFLK